VWNAVGSRTYEAGLDRGVLYLDGQPGIAWSGLTGVTESPSGGDNKTFYLDGVKYLNYSSVEEFQATLTAFTHPIEFAACDGSARARAGLFLGQQRRKTFGLTYRTKIGNDLAAGDFGYKIHLVYNALTGGPADRAYSSLGKSDDATDFSWTITTKPMTIPGYQPTSYMVLDSRFVDPIALGKIEDLLYGNDTQSAQLPSWTDLIAILDEPQAFDLIDNGDGTYEIDAPASIMTVTSGVFALTWPGAVNNGNGTYTISD
jgi:hypothetical protein